MDAGFARADITPPVGTRMEGFGGRDHERGAEAVHDKLYVRALYVCDQGEEVLILAFDLLFFSRENADRLKAAIGRRLDLSPRQILLNCSHTHAGPCVSTYTDAYDRAPDRAYMSLVERGVVEAAVQARAAAREVTLRAGATRTCLPVSRRKPDGGGGVEWRPYPEGTNCPHLPLCLFQDMDGRPVCLLFSVSCHPSTVGGWVISADYPGAACARLDAHLGATAAMFLQGAGGDTKASPIADGRDELDVAWRSGNWDDVDAAGEIVATEVIAALEAGLDETQPSPASAIIDTHWPLQAIPDRCAFAEALREPGVARRTWAERHLRLLDRGLPIAESAEIIVQGITLGEGLRLIAIEGEMVGELGLEIIAACEPGLTFPLGYSNGLGLYLPNTRMVGEGGYEVDSYYEYGFAAPLREGTEQILRDAVAELKRLGIR